MVVKIKNKLCANVPKGPRHLVSVSNVSGLVSVWKATCLGHSALSWDFENRKKWLSKIYINHRVICLLYMQVKNNPNMSEKFRKIQKNQLRSDNILWKFSEKSTTFQVSNLGLGFFWWSLGLEVQVSTESLWLTVASTWWLLWLVRVSG